MTYLVLISSNNLTYFSMEDKLLIQQSGVGSDQFPIAFFKMTLQIEDLLVIHIFCGLM